MLVEMAREELALITSNSTKRRAVPEELVVDREMGTVIGDIYDALRMK
jgi:hypothetical protein